MVKLKNGSKAPEELVEVVTTSIKYLRQSGMNGLTTVSDLVRICRRDPKYRKFGKNEDTLKELTLLQDNGQPHESVRNIVVSSFTGDGLNLKFNSPIAK